MGKTFEVIPSNKHVLVCGTTGTGKSYFCEHYIRASYKYVVKLDTKDEVSERRMEGRPVWEGLEEGKDVTVCHKLEELDDCETDKIIFCPDFYDQTIEMFETFFNWVFARQNTVLWIDELMSIGTAQAYPRALGRIMQQGRSKNVGVFACTQRPSGIPSIVPANASYFVIYAMPLPQDRKKVMEVSGMPELYEMPDGHNFWFYKVGDKKPSMCKLEI